MAISTTISPPRPYVEFVTEDRKLTGQGYDFLFGLYRRVGGSLSDLNAATLLDQTWSEPGPIGNITPSTAIFTTLGTTSTYNFPGIRNNGVPLEIKPTGSPGTIDNMAIGATTPSTIIATEIRANTRFGLNGSPQLQQLVGVSLTGYSGGAFGLSSALEMQALYQKVEKLELALRNFGLVIT